MSDKKNQPNFEANPAQKQQNPNTSETKTIDQTANVGKQIPVPKNDKSNLKDRQLTTQRLGLVLYEMMKKKQSLFTEEQKYPLVASMGGIALTLTSASLVTFAQRFLHLQEKKQKLLFRFGLVNLLASMFLGFYSLFKLTDMYVKVPQAQWNIIEKEKQAYDKLSFQQKRAYFEKEIQEEAQKIKQAAIQKQVLSRQEKIDLTK